MLLRILFEDAFDHVDSIYADLSILTFFIIGYMLIRFVSKKGKIGKPKEIDERNSPLIDFNKYIKDVWAFQENVNPFSILDEMRMKNVIPDTTTFNTLLDIHITRGNFRSCDEIMKRMEIDGVNKDSVTYNTLLKRISCELKSHTLNSTNYFETAMGIIDEMERKSIQINTITFNTLFDACIRVNDIDNIQIVYDRMKDKKVYPDEITYGTIVRGLRLIESREDKKKLMGILEKMLENFNEGNEQNLNALLNGCFAVGDVTRVLFIYNKISKTSISINTYRVLLKGFGELKMGKQIEEIWNIFKDNTELDEMTLSCLVNALIKCEMILSAKDIIAKSKNANTVTYSILLKGLARQEDLAHAMELLDIMKQNSRLVPNLVTYNTLLDAAVSQNQFSLMRKIYNEMIDSDIGVDLISVSTYIKGLFRDEQHIEAMEFFQKIKSEGSVKVDEILYNIVMDGLVRVGKYERAVELFSEMQKENFKPSNVTYSIMVRAESGQKRLDEALAILKGMKDSGMSPGKVVYTCILKACVRFKKVKTMLHVYEEMISTGVTPDNVLYQTVIYGCLSGKEYLEAGKILLTVLQKGPMIKKEMVNKVLEALCILLERENGENEEVERLLLQICLELKRKNEELDGEILRRVIRFLCKKNCSEISNWKDERRIPKFVNRKNINNKSGKSDSKSDLKSLQLSDLHSDSHSEYRIENF